jgi:hypothetical protein
VQLRQSRVTAGDSLTSIVHEWKKENQLFMYGQILVLWLTISYIL